MSPSWVKLLWLLGLDHAKLPPHVSTMIHNQKIELDSIRKERNHLKKIVEGMGGIESQELNKVSNVDLELKDKDATEISDLNKVSTLEDKVSILELKSGIKSSNLKKVETLELKVHQLISLLLMSWAVIVGFVIAKMMQCNAIVCVKLVSWVG